MTITDSTTKVGAGASNSTITDNPEASSSSAPVLVAPEPPRDALDTATATTSQPLSKRAQKRASKAAYLRSKKLERRQRERAARKEKKRERREGIGRGELGPDEDEGKDGGEPSKKKLRKSYVNAGDVIPFKATVVVDLGFDSYMSEKEIISLGSQLAYCYSANRKSSHPFETLLFTSLNGRLRDRLERENDAGYKRWTRCEWWEEGYERLWADGIDLPSKDEVVVEEEKEKAGGDEEKKSSSRSRSSKDAVVYLTADADEELEGLKEGETYILGGIVDRNRYKSLCQKKASTQGIRTASLPIGKYLKELKTRKVLTVNQVFEILIHWAESRNWEEALYGVMPKRKFTQNQSGKPQATDKGAREDAVEIDGVETEVHREEENDASSGSGSDASERGKEE